LAEEVNKYLNQKMPPANISEPRLVLGNMALAQDQAAPAEAKVDDKAVLSLVLIEEDRVAKQQEHFTKTDTKTQYKNPPLFLNLYILFSLNKIRYADNLQLLGYIIQFFQHQYVFTPITHPGLDSRIQQIVVDMCNMGFEQNNHIWSILGGKHYPSVMYKMRQITLDENLLQGESGLITTISLSGKHQTPVS
jgi:hypothetical protein